LDKILGLQCFIDRQFIDRQFIDRQFINHLFIDRQFIDRQFIDWPSSSTIYNIDPLFHQ
jgi:hypothetical protein